jgi:hypothetical protein
MVITIVSDCEIKTGFGPLDRSIEFGTNLGKNAFYQKWTKDGSGTMLLAGQNLNYQTGVVALNTHKVPEFRGWSSFKDKNVSVDAFGQIDKPFDIPQLQSFLNCIATFK